MARLAAAVGALPPSGDYFGSLEKRQPGGAGPLVPLANLPGPTAELDAHAPVGEGAKFQFGRTPLVRP